jgi:hypothetical protein
MTSLGFIDTTHNNSPLSQSKATMAEPPVDEHRSSLPPAASQMQRWLDNPRMSPLPTSVNCEQLCAEAEQVLAEVSNRYLRSDDSRYIVLDMFILMVISLYSCREKDGQKYLLCDPSANGRYEHTGYMVPSCNSLHDANSAVFMILGHLIEQRYPNREKLVGQIVDIKLRPYMNLDKYSYTWSDMMIELVFDNGTIDSVSRSKCLKGGLLSRSETNEKLIQALRVAVQEFTRAFVDRSDHICHFPGCRAKNVTFEHLLPFSVIVRRFLKDNVAPTTFDKHPEQKMCMFKPEDSRFVEAWVIFHNDIAFAEGNCTVLCKEHNKQGSNEISKQMSAVLASENPEESLAAWVAPVVHKEPCGHFVRHGTCGFMATCRYDHSAHLYEPKPKEPCVHFFRFGTCSFGAKCKFDHSAQPPSIKPSQKKQCIHFAKGHCKLGNKCNFGHY